MKNRKVYLYEKDSSSDRLILTHETEIEMHNISMFLGPRKVKDKRSIYEEIVIYSEKRCLIKRSDITTNYLLERISHMLIPDNRASYIYTNVFLNNDILIDRGIKVYKVKRFDGYGDIYLNYEPTINPTPEFFDRIKRETEEAEENYEKYRKFLESLEKKREPLVWKGI